MNSSSKSRRYNLKRLYGLTPELWDVMFRGQDGRCPICGRRLTNTTVVDHDHETGKVRGLLCSRCNSGLGMFEDNIRLLARAIVYLEEHGKRY